jgi:diaminopimelate epimerase
MQGCGNDFIVVEDPVALDAARVRALCDRRRGIGADGVLVIGAPEAGRVWPVAIHNADGSIGESCGNGARCVARYLLDRHGGDSVTLRFAGGEVRGTRHGAGIAISLASPSNPEPVTIDGAGAYRVRVGNPHIVLWNADPERSDLTAIARRVRAAGGDANVELARIDDAEHIRLRVDERGVGETLACGTGACATVAAALRERRMAPTVTVRVPGGDLLVRHGATTYELAGPAEYAFEGTL